MMLANHHENLSDTEMIRKKMRVAELAEEVGYDSVWCAGHHFDAYSITVDNIQVT